ncbi:MAG: hypothetical protein J7518_01515 [Nocardioidaceae bacterium]|nr:hypothetical protein [Nocardioidaceae bacterium]
MAWFRVRTVRRRRRDEHGVVAILLAVITCFTLIPLAAYAVDIGVQRVARRDVQGAADMVALDLARQLDGRKYSQLQGTLQSLANKSLARNAHGVGRDLVVIPELGTIDKTKYDKNNPQGYFTPITSDAGGIPNAVRVTASSDVDFSLHQGNGGVNRVAIAASQAQVCFDIGSFALNLSSANSPLLNSLVGDALNLSAISYTGLANANVSLLGLATELGVGSVDGLLNLNNLSLNDLYLASARALQKSGGETADVTLLNNLAAANLGMLPRIKLSDVLDLEAGNNAALSSSLNLLDLVSTSAFVANGTNALAVPNLTAGIPGIAGVSASLKVIEGAKGGCGIGNEVKTSQISLTLNVDLTNVDILLLAAKTTLSINVEVASAKAKITNAFCGTPTGVDVSVATGLAATSVGLSVDLKTLGLTIANVYANLGTSPPAASPTVQFRNPPDAYGVPKKVGTAAILPTIGSADLHIDVLGVLPLLVTTGGLLSGVLSSIVTPIVNPLITSVNTNLLDPLTKFLGIELGGADVYVNKAPTCNNPVLAG